MTNVIEKTKVKAPPKKGWMKELAQEEGVDYNTVRNAIYNNAQSAKSERIRKRFIEKYGDVSIA